MSANARILTPQDSQWTAMLERLPRHDFYHLPDYVQLEAERRDGTALAFAFENADGAFFVPFVECHVPLLLWPPATSRCDVLAPYGYAGPLAHYHGDPDRREAFWRGVFDSMSESFRARGAGTIFICLHPLLAPPLEAFSQKGSLVCHGETVWVDLRKTPEELWSNTRRDFRNPINRMRREGFVFELDADGREIPVFVELYHETMRRVHADARYFFSEAYFRKLHALLGPGAGCVFAHVRAPSGRIVASGIFTMCCGIVQFHLSGSRLGEEGGGASKLLLHGIREWARAQGCEKFHLGGGLGARSDSLFLFKTGLSSSRALYHTWRLVLDEQGYAKRCHQWERLNARQPDTMSGFFPAYRRPPGIARMTVASPEFAETAK